MVQMLSTFLFISFIRLADERCNRFTANEVNLFRTIIMIVLKFMMGFHSEIICYLIVASGENTKDALARKQTKTDV